MISQEPGIRLLLEAAPSSPPFTIDQRLLLIRKVDEWREHGSRQRALREKHGRDILLEAKSLRHLYFEQLALLKLIW